MAKDNIRSFRYSGQVAAILEAAEGKSLNDKFENIVLYCYYKLEERKQALAEIEKEIEKQREKLHNLSRATEQIRDLENTLMTAKHYMNIIERQAESIAKTAEEYEQPKINLEPDYNIMENAIKIGKKK
ncbi:MAG: hypothetical protein RR011_05090 [Oscillospiraceae bacterium]